jgi:hypothetical protein
MGGGIRVMNTAHASSFDSADGKKEKVRHAVQGGEPSIFTDIYQQETNIVIWQRQLPDTLKHSVAVLLKSMPTFQTTMTVAPSTVFSDVSKFLGDTGPLELSKDIAELANRFCYLFNLKRVRLGLTAIDRAMCPKFHVDNIPCRLITTFQGIGTEWLPHQSVNREKLGIASNGKADDQSGLYKTQHDIQQLSCGEVALLKGEAWIGNENAGLVHRSPVVIANEHRLLLTLDFSS